MNLPRRSSLPLLITTFLQVLPLPQVDSALVQYQLDVRYCIGAPDGVTKRKFLAINNQLPGPTIEAQIGDTLRVTVINSIQDGQNTTMHWHGIHQKGSIFEDGVSQVTQCPIKKDEHQVYEFQLEQAGTYWYHSHHGSQYTDGVWGSLIIRNKPEVYQYDGEILITLTDWNHRTAHQVEVWYQSFMSWGNPPFPDSGLINGVGRYNCTLAPERFFPCDPEKQRRPIFNVLPGKKYRVRVINVGGFAMFHFSIDRHILYTIEVDGVDVARPVPFDAAVLSPGERYSFLIETEEGNEGAEFLIRADIMTEHLTLKKGQNINPFPEFLLPNLTAVLRYVNPNVNLRHLQQYEQFDYTRQISERPIPQTDMILLDQNLLEPHDQVHAPDRYDQEIILEIQTYYDDANDIRHGSFNGTPFKLPDGKPFLLSVMDGEELPATANALRIEYGTVVQVVLNNPVHGAHPFHLHGHSFWVLGTGKANEGNYNPNKHELVLDGARRDTYTVEEYSWSVIRFVADNPGVWTFHCHNDWHNVVGMIATFIEAPELMRQRYQVPEEIRRVCAHHGLRI